MPLRTSRDRVLPKPAPKRKAPIRSAIASLSTLSPLAPSLRLQQVGGVLDGGRLREVDDVDRVLAGRHQLLEGLVERLHRPAEAERDRALRVVDDGGVAAGALLEVVDEEGDVAERRGHQEELRVEQLEQRHLPGPAAVVLRVEVELVHHHEADVGGATLAQRDVGQHLGGAADDRRVRVHRRVAGEHADVVGAEDLDQGEELLAHQRLDRCGVEAHLVPRERGGVRADGDQRLPGAGRRREDDVVAAEELDHRLVLVRVELEALVDDPPGEGVVDRIRVGAGRDPGVESRGGIRHGSIQPSGRPFGSFTVGPRRATAVKPRGRTLSP